MIGNKIYVYGLLDKNDNVIYVGKSSAPKHRLLGHNNYSSKLKILDVFEDREVYWIEKLLQEGHSLANKQWNYHTEEWNIGDIIEINRGKGIKIYDSQTQKTYDSFSSLSKELNIPYQTIQYRIQNCNESHFNDYKRYILI
jgi:predicted GIY-YIG superfamily endonuclease